MQIQLSATYFIYFLFDVCDINQHHIVVVAAAVLFIYFFFSLLLDN